MGWWLAGLLAAYALLAEVVLRAELHHFDETVAKATLTVAGFRKTWRVRLVKTAQGRRLFLSDKQGTRPLQTGALRQSRGGMLLDAFLRADKARAFLLRFTHLERLDGQVLLRTEDAARCAMLTGGVQAVLNCIPALRRGPVRIRILPDFFRAHTTVDARCIIRLRVGTIILTAGMLLLAWLRERRLQESEAT